MMSRNVIKFCYRNINKTVGLEGKAGYPERAVTVGLQFVYNCETALTYHYLRDIINAYSEIIYLGYFRFIGLRRVSGRLQRKPFTEEN